MTSEITRHVKFPQFGVVSDPSGHHFFNSKPSKTGGAQKTIMKEWKLLAKELPDSIYVRVYETRVDLLCAAIVGARSTPYHDGLFFFDISFPSDYPARPPLVYYRSFGLRINPNLYANGRVCLSLLHTWEGLKSEKWDSKNSNVLQVLLSIQALVLNEKPFFNEPGYAAGAGVTLWEKKSLAYSENAFVLSCKTMLFLLSKPPKNFEPLIKQHFIDRAEFILNACDMYRKGLVKVGMFDGVVSEGKAKVSKKFAAAIDAKFGALVKAFARNGAPVKHFVKRVRKVENKPKEKPVVKKKAKVSMIIKKLKNVFVGLMKKKSKTSPVLEAPQDTEGTKTVQMVS